MNSSERICGETSLAMYSMAWASLTESFAAALKAEFLAEAKLP
jgi:hypothetical protein